jgi:hypothetical protein
MPARAVRRCVNALMNGPIDWGVEPRMGPLSGLPGDINPFALSWLWFSSDPVPPPNFHPPHLALSPTLSFNFILLASGTLYTPQTLFSDDKPLSPRTITHPLPKPTTSPRHPPIIMSIRRNNVRVSFLFNDSESSLELCVYNDILCQLGPLADSCYSLGHSHDRLPRSASRRSTSRGGSSARGRRSLGPPGRRPGTLSSLRVSS